ncbi:hypothetical protein [Paenibacillus contaminans]|uniref:Uncharacterized protein n=1 Tax=Paenibacillus contaminans TaxID=450362 RepID=A0A329MHM4_9BACL|nr:hypothetical protein [Paenibacillus contaminans]RAV19461.1 hypothetical protein DQG23_20945 [Paenibacillus contaminans]
MSFFLQQRLYNFLTQQFNPDGSIHFLAISAIKLEQEKPNLPTNIKVRLALTFQDSSGMNPYFDGTDLYITITPEDIRFIEEEVWAKGHRSGKAV